MEQSVTHTEMGIVIAAILSSVELKEGTKKFSLFHFLFLFFCFQNYNKGIMKHHDQAVGETSVSSGNKVSLTEGW